MTINNRDTILGIVRELYGKISYNQKAHDKEREILARNFGIAKWSNIVLEILTFALIVARNIWALAVLDYITPLAAVASVALGIYNLSFQLDKRESLHRQAAKRLLLLKEELIFLIQELMSTSEEVSDDLKSRIKFLNKEIHLVYEQAPDISTEASHQAQLSLRIKEEFSFSAEEIDFMLPNELRIHKQTKTSDLIEKNLPNNLMPLPALI